MQFLSRKVFTLCLLFLCWPFLIFAENIEGQEPLYRLKDFYETPPGTVAFVPDVYVEKKTTGAKEFFIMSSGLYHFPKQKLPYYCFILNHKNLGTEKKTYLAIEIISIMKQKQIYPVYLYRNAGWERETLDPQYTFKGDSREIKELALSVNDFFTAHLTSNLGDIDKKLKHPWHGTVKGSSINSWENYLIWNDRDAILSEQFFENFEKEIKDPTNLKVDARLISFSPTKKSFLQIWADPKPVDFCITCEGKEAFYLELYVPNSNKDSRFYITFDE